MIIYCLSLDIIAKPHAQGQNKSMKPIGLSNLINKKYFFITEEVNLILKDL